MLIDLEILIYYIKYSALTKASVWADASDWAEALGNQPKHSKVNQDSEVVILQFQYASIQITSVRHSKLDICIFNSLSI